MATTASTGDSIIKPTTAPTISTIRFKIASPCICTTLRFALLAAIAYYRNFINGTMPIEGILGKSSFRAASSLQTHCVKDDGIYLIDIKLFCRNTTRFLSHAVN